MVQDEDEEERSNGVLDGLLNQKMTEVRSYSFYLQLVYYIMTSSAQFHVPFIFSCSNYHDQLAHTQAAEQRVPKHSSSPQDETEVLVRMQLETTVTHAHHAQSSKYGDQKGTDNLNVVEDGIVT